MSWTTYRNRPDAYLDEAFEVTAKRIAVSEWLMDESDWDLLASVWVTSTGPSTACRTTSRPTIPTTRRTRTPDRAEGRRRLPAARRRDRGFVSRAREDDLILFISDHGFQTCTRALHMDHLLKQFGFLEFSASQATCRPDAVGPDAQGRAQGLRHAGAARQGLAAAAGELVEDEAYTTIRSTGEGVTINLAGRELDGIVDPGDFEKVRDEVMDRLGAFVDPKTGKKPVKAIAKREEVFKGASPSRRPTS